MPASDLLAAGRRVLQLVDELPTRISAVVETMLDDARDALDDFELELRTAHDANPPLDLHDLPGWHAERPSLDEDLASWWVRVGDGPAALATDGHAALIVEVTQGAPEKSTRMTAVQAAKIVAKLTDANGRSPVSIATAELARVLELADPPGEVLGVCVAGATTLDASLVRRWVLTAAQVAAKLFVHSDGRAVEIEYRRAERPSLLERWAEVSAENARLQADVDEARGALVKLHGALYQDDVPRRRAIAEAGELVARWAAGGASSPWHREHHGDGRWTDRQVVGEPVPGGTSTGEGGSRR